MNQSSVSVDEWVAMFRAILDADDAGLRSRLESRLRGINEQMELLRNQQRLIVEEGLLNEGEEEASLAPTPGYRYAKRVGAQSGVARLGYAGQLVEIDATVLRSP